MLDSILTLAVIFSTTLSLFLIALPSRYTRHSLPKSTTNASAAEPKTSVQVLVLGDIGRSPRMQYHAASIAKHGGRVDVIGYQGWYLERPHANLTNAMDRIHFSSCPHREPSHHNHPTTSSTTSPTIESPSFHTSRPTQSHMADRESFLRIGICHKAFEMAAGAEPTFNTYTRYRHDYLLLTEHKSDNRLA